MAQASRIDFDVEDITCAAETTAAEKFIAGATLFDYACSVMMAGIRQQHPNATEEQVLEIVRERLDWAKRWE